MFQHLEMQPRLLQKLITANATTSATNQPQPAPATAPGRYAAWQAKPSHLPPAACARPGAERKR
jgi:hypothetical protein